MTRKYSCSRPAQSAYPHFWTLTIQVYSKVEFHWPYACSRVSSMTSPAKQLLYCSTARKTSCPMQKCSWNLKILMSQHLFLRHQILLWFPLTRPASQSRVSSPARVSSTKVYVTWRIGSEFRTARLKTWLGTLDRLRFPSAGRFSRMKPAHLLLIRSLLCLGQQDLTKLGSTKRD